MVFGRAARKRRRTVAHTTVEQALRNENHARKVERIAAHLKNYDGSAPLARDKRSVSHQVPKESGPSANDARIDIRDLNAILAVDVDKRLCVAEPGVTYVDLVEATLPFGLVPYVVPELKTITIGGAVAGCSLESMSFRYGGFHDSCVEYEVITGKGEVITCTPDGDDALVFNMMHGTFGTLGILSRLTFKLIPAKQFVRVDYEVYDKLPDYLDAIARHRHEDDLDFMDGIIHSPTKYALSLGRFVDKAPYTNHYYWTKVYYQSTATRKQDYLRTPAYFFRYDRGVTNVHPKSKLATLLFGWMFGSSQVLWIAEKFPWIMNDERPDIILDVFVPFSKVPEFLDWYGREFRHFPLWCVPYRRVHDYEWIADQWHEQLKDDMFVDLAIYGMKQRGDTNYYKLMEEKLDEIGGIKTLIAHNYYAESDFWRIWNKRNYDEVKRRTDPDNIFRDLYSKTHKMR